LYARILPITQSRVRRRGRNVAKTYEDVAQEVLLVMCDPNENAASRRYKAVERDKFLRWIFHIVRNKIGDFIREPVLDKLDDLSSDESTSEDAAECQLSEVEINELICRALRRLKPKYREVMQALIEMSQGNPMPENLQELSKNAWYSRVHRGRKQFREALRKEGFQP